MDRLLIVLLLLSSAPAIAATRAPKESWGRAGVPFDQYRRDSVECGRQGYYLDISNTDDAKAFVRGSRELDDVTESASSAAPGSDPVETTARFAKQDEQIRARVQPERRIGHLKAMMQSAVDQCLIGRGYARFRLTDTQRRELDKFPIGSARRISYLYRLASNAEILKAQTL